MSILVLSSSLDPNSHSRDVARLCQEKLEQRNISTTFVDLADFDVPNFDNASIYQTDAYKRLHALTQKSEGIILCSPVYNWGVSSELKKYIEYVGSTPPEGNMEGALFDKIVTFVNAGGLPHSYTAFRELATSLMLDFKCIINPYHIYVHKRNWQGDALSARKIKRIEKSMAVMVELCDLLGQRTYQSTWEI